MAEPQQNDAKSALGRFQNRTITLTVSFPKFFFGAVFGVVLLIWAFIFGVMIGRGHNPEKIVPELARVMPKTDAPTRSAPKPDVLSSQDLGYRATLKDKPAQAPGSPAEAPAPQTPPKPPVTQPAPKPSPEPRAEAPRPEPPAPASTNDETVYDFLYQVSASTNKAASEALLRRLTASGLTARSVENTDKGRTWYRILVSFRGTPDDTRNLRLRLAEHDIHQTILRDKVPVDTRKPPRDRALTPRR